MADGLVDALRERVRLRSILIGVGVLAVLRAVFDTSLAQLGVTVATGAIFGLSEAAEEAYDLRSEVRRLAFGGVVVVSGGALLTFDDGAAWLPVAFLVIGAWILSDAVQALRHGGLTDGDDPPDGEEVYHRYVVRRVHETLDDRPRTRRELSEALDSDDEDVDRALDTLEERDLLDRAGSELRIASSDPSRLATAHEKLGSGVSRVARPVALELEEE